MNKSQVSNFQNKLFFVCNELHFFNIQSYAIVFLRFFILNLALASLLDDVSFVLNAYDSVALNLLLKVNNYLFFFTIPPFDGSIASDIFNVTVTIVVSALLTVHIYCLLTIESDNKASQTTGNNKKLTILKIISLNFIYGSLPYGTFCLYYMGKLVLSSWPYLIVIPTANLLGILLINYSYEEFSNESDYQNFNAFSIFYHQNQSKLTVSILFFKIFISSLGILMYTKSLLIATCLTFLLLDLIDLRYIATRKIYFDTTTEKIKQFWLAFELSIQVCLIVSLCFDNGLMINNFTFMMPTITFLGFHSIQAYKKYRNEALLLGGVSKIQTEGDATFFMFSLLTLASNKNHHQSLIFSGLIKQHLSNCTNRNCFCRNFNSNIITIKQQKSTLSFNFILMNFQDILKKYPKSFTILTIYLNFRIAFIKSFTKSSIEMQKFNKRNRMSMSKGNLFLIYQLSNKLKQGLQQINYDIASINPNKIFLEDSLLSQLTTNLTSLNNLNIKKYSKIESDFFSLNQIEIMCANITDLIRSIESSWLQFKDSSSNNIKLYECFLIYFSYMIHCKSAVLQIKSTIVSKIALTSHLKILNCSNLQDFLYDKRACVIESSLQLNELGPITNISKSCQYVFRCPKQSLIGQVIENVMANFLAVPHRQLIKNWIEKDKVSTALNGITPVFFTDFLHRSFRGKIFLKAHSMGVDLKFYGLMVKQNQEDYLILNDKFVIQSFGRRLASENIFNQRHWNQKFSLVCECDLEDLMKDRTQVRRTMVINNKAISQSGQYLQIKGKPQTENKSLLQVQDPKNTTQLFQSEVIISKNRLGKSIYYSLKFGDIKHLPNHQSNLLNIEGKNRQRKISILQENNVYLKVAQQSKSIIKDEQIKQIELAPNASLHQSYISGNTDLRYRKILEKVRQRTIRYKQYWNSTRVIASGIIIVLLALIICIMFLETQIYKAKLNSVNDFNQAIMTVAGNFQYFKISSNSILMASIYCQSTSQVDSQRCLELKQKTSIILNEAYDGIYTQLLSYDQKMTNSIRNNGALSVSVTLKIGKIQQKVTIMEFMKNYYYALVQINSEMQPNSTNMSASTAQKSSFLYQNWKQYKQITVISNEFYQNQIMSLLSTLSTQIYLTSTCFLALVMGLVLTIGISERRSLQKKKKYLNIYTLIPPSYSAYLKSFFTDINSCLISGNEIPELLPNQQRSRIIKRKFQYQSKSFSIITLLIIIFLLFQGLNISNILNLATIVSPAKSVVSILTNLITAESHSFQNLLQLKTYYLQYNFNKTVKDISHELLIQLNQTEINYITHIRESIALFHNFDHQYADQINYLFTVNLCNQTAKGYPDLLASQCNHNQKIDIISQGLAAGWTFLQRSSMEALIDLQNDPTIDKRQYFKQQLYQDLDTHIFFMFKLSEQIKKRIILQLHLWASANNDTAQLIQIFTLVIITAILAGWWWNCKRQNQNSGYLYGTILQLPHMWLVQNKMGIKVLDQDLNIV